MRIVKSVALLVLLVLLASSLYADLRQGNVREKGSCAIPPYDCVYTQSGWHKLENGWYVSGGEGTGAAWSDGVFSDYMAAPFGVCCDSLVKWVAFGGGFAYYYGSQVPETVSLEFWKPYADIFYREVSGCCPPLSQDDLIRRYTFDTADIWPTNWSEVATCRYGDGLMDWYDDFEKVGLALDPPMELDADCNYLIGFYANGDITVRWWTTIDMMCGPDRFKVTEDAGKTFKADWYWHGGDVTANLDFELRGDLIDCYSLCDVCDQAGWEVLYDQAAKHVGSNGSWWGGGAYGAGDSTAILGQAFNYQWDGYVQCIGVGGWFGDVVPQNLIVELWYMAGQSGDWCVPITLYRRWMVPVDALHETTDPEGGNLYNFFTEEYPGPYTWCDSTAPGGECAATDDRPFLFVCYSDGDSTAPFYWYTDMCKGLCRFSDSAECEQEAYWLTDVPPSGVTGCHNFFWGVPEEGNIEANFSFLLAGGCNEVHGPTAEDEVVTSGYLAGPLFGQPQGGYPGWVWFSIPVDPANCCDAADCYDPGTLLGTYASGKLYMWDKYLKAVKVYKPPFSKFPLKVGESYLLYMTEAIANPVYSGVDPYVSARLAGFDLEPLGKWSSVPEGKYDRRQDYDFEVLLGKQGWTWVGLPGKKPIYGGGTNSDFGTEVRVMYPALPTWQGGTGVVRTAAQDLAQTPNNWVDWGWSYYDTRLQSPKAFKFNATFGNKHCFPWIGYRVYVKVGTAAGEAKVHYDENTQTAVFENTDQAMLIWPSPEKVFRDTEWP